MERMMSGKKNLLVNIKLWISLALETAVWNVTRAVRYVSRHFGLWGWGLLCCMIIGIAIWTLDTYQRAQIIALQSKIASQLNRTMVPSLSTLDIRRINAVEGEGGRARLQLFDRYLLSHEDIPVVIQDLLQLAEENGLSILKGEYRPQVDTAGGFLRYKMLLPVKGPVVAVHHFIQATLRKHKTLAMESVQFKRERIDSPEIEARIQWDLLVRLPTSEMTRAVNVSDSVGDAQ